MPCATNRTAATATRPSHATLAPTPVRPNPPPTATSQPSDFSHRDGQGRGACARRQRHGGMQGPAQGRSADRFEPIGELVVAGRRCSRPGGPDHDLPGRPRCLEPDLADRIGGDDRRRGIRRPRQEVVSRLEASQLLLEIGDHLVALRPRKLAHGIKVVFGLVEQTLQGDAPRARVSLEQRELIFCCIAIGRCPRSSFESTCVVMHV